MGYTKTIRSAIRIGCASTNLSDSSDYYFGTEGTGATTGTGSRKIYIYENCRIFACSLYFRNGNDATEEDTTIAIRKNGATDYVVYTGTVGAASGVNFIQNSALNVPIASGDYIEMKITTPAWVTNPTSTTIQGDIWIET